MEIDARDSGAMERIMQTARALGPYLLIVLLVPGGSLIVPLLWLFRRFRM